jgi:hypothetical protein
VPLLEYKAVQFDRNILFVTNTGLPFINYGLPGFDVHIPDSPSPNVLIAIKKPMASRQYQHTIRPWVSGVEAIFVELTVARKKFLLISCYADTRVTIGALIDFTRTLQEFRLNQFEDVVIFGDLNIDYSDQGHQFVNRMMELGYNQVVERPTFRGKINDHLWVRRRGQFNHQIQDMTIDFHHKAVEFNRTV